MTFAVASAIKDEQHKNISQIQAQNVTKARLVLAQTRSSIFHHHFPRTIRPSPGRNRKARRSHWRRISHCDLSLACFTREIEGHEEHKRSAVLPRSSEIGAPESSLGNETLTKQSRERRAPTCELRCRIFHSRLRIRENPGRGRE